MRKDSLKRPLHSASFLLLSSVLILASGCSYLKKAPELKGTPWETHLSDQARTNWSEDEAAPPFALRWAKDVSPSGAFKAYPKEELSSPAISDGALYVAGSDETLYSLDVRTGGYNWMYDAHFPLEAPPAVSEKEICLGSGDGVLVCLDKATGKELWRFQARSEVLSSPVVAEGKVFFYSADDKIHALDLKTGERVWSYSRSTFMNVSARMRGSSAYSRSNGGLFHIFSDGSLVALSADTGKELWAKRVFKDPAEMADKRTSPLASDGIVYAIDGSGSIVAYDSGTGETKGVYNVIKAKDFLLAGNRTLVVAGTDMVVAIDRRSGAILWKKEPDKRPVVSIFSSGDTLFLLSNYTKSPLGIKFLSSVKGHAEAIGLKDGKTLWETGLYSTVSSGGASSGGSLAFFTDKGVIEVFSPR